MHRLDVLKDDVTLRRKQNYNYFSFSLISFIFHLLLLLVLNSKNSCSGSEMDKITHIPGEQYARPVFQGMSYNDRVSQYEGYRCNYRNILRALSLFCGHYSEAPVFSILHVMASTEVLLPAGEQGYTNTFI